MNKVSGIYLITNIIENKNYVGRSVNCFERFSKHKSLLRKNIHHNQHLQNSWNKYGNENFIFEIIDECYIEYLPSLENWWCNMLNVHDREYGYNIEPTGSFGRICASNETKEKIRISNTGKKCSEETKLILREINTGKKCSEETKSILRNNKLNQPIDVYDNLGNFIQTYKSIRDCSRNLNIDNKCIKRCILGEFNLFHNMIFKTQNDILSKEEIKERNINSHEYKKIKIIGYYLDGTIVGEFDSFYQAEKSTGLNSTKISLCCKGKQKRVKNTKWSYK